MLLPKHLPIFTYNTKAKPMYTLSNSNKKDLLFYVVLDNENTLSVLEFKIGLKKVDHVIKKYKRDSTLLSPIPQQGNKVAKTPDTIRKKPSSSNPDVFSGSKPDLLDHINSTLKQQANIIETLKSKISDNNEEIIEWEAKIQSLIDNLKPLAEENDELSVLLSKYS